MSRYIKYFDKIKYTFFLIKDEKLLETNSKIWDNISNLIKKKT